MLCTEGHCASESQEGRRRVRGTPVPARAHVPRARPRPPCAPTCAEAEPSCSLVSLGNRVEAKIVQGGAGGAPKCGLKSSAPGEPRRPSRGSGDTDGSDGAAALGRLGVQEGMCWWQLGCGGGVWRGDIFW